MSTEMFIVKQYSSDSRPIIKGFGFDGLTIGEDREEAQEFINFVNSLLSIIDNKNYKFSHNTESYHEDIYDEDYYEDAYDDCEDWDMHNE